MDLSLINRLPKITRPRYEYHIFSLTLFSRKGLLEKIERSREELSNHELKVAQEAFSLFDIDQSSKYTHSQKMKT